MPSANGANLIDFVFLETGSVAPKNFPTYQWHLRCAVSDIPDSQIRSPYIMFQTTHYPTEDTIKIKMVELPIGCWADSKVG